MLSIDCNSCGKEFEMALDETTIYVYDEPQFNHISTTCEHCTMQTVLFFAEPSFLTLGYPIVHQPEAPWHVCHIWAQLNDPDNLPEDPRKNTEDTRTADDEMDEIVERRFHDWIENINPGDFS